MLGLELEAASISLLWFAEAPHEKKVGHVREDWGLCSNVVSFPHMPLTFALASIEIYRSLAFHKLPTSSKVCIGVCLCDSEITISYS